MQPQRTASLARWDEIREAPSAAPPSVHGHLVLKRDDTFGVFDSLGDVRRGEVGRQGLYHRDTRHLSTLLLRIQGHTPLLLSSNVSREGHLLSVDLSNPVFRDGPRRNSLHIYRGRFLERGAWREQLRFTNFGDDPVDLEATLEFAADFRDVFEVRGQERQRRGEPEDPVTGADRVVLGYRGLDDIVRRTSLRLTGSADGELSVDPARFTFRLRLPSRATTARELEIRCEPRDGDLGSPPVAFSFGEGQREAARALADRRRNFAHVETSNPVFDAWWERSIDDVVMLVTDHPEGPYPYAGVPWFSTTFGRDGIVTALECTWVAPFLARGVLSYLAATQARDEDPDHDAEPGKILHEARWGEMANLGEVPFGRYYGSLDATPLFLVLAGAYWRRTGDRPFMESLLPALRAALDWMDGWGDRDGDGFLEYERRGEAGLRNQGWKDSEDSVFHRDGTLARGPVALVEVQGYAYRARREMARLFRDLGDEEVADRLTDGAEQLARRFEAAFWDAELESYVLGLDGDKRPLRVRTSNAGHVLFAGVASPERAARTADTLMDAVTMHSGWGIRTLAADEVRYSPMSYHNGSVWPHDNALVAGGYARYGLTDRSVRLLESFFDASQRLSLRRMPELFCGFHRRTGEDPVLYPVACSPQAWAAGAVCLLLQASLGLTIDGHRGTVRFRRPRLPSFLEHVGIRRLAVGGATIDLELERVDADGRVRVTQPGGGEEEDVEVTVRDE